MWGDRKTRSIVGVGAGSLLVMVVGLGWLPTLLLVIVGLAGYGYVFYRRRWRERLASGSPARPPANQSEPMAAPAPAPVPVRPADPNDVNGLVKRMLSEGRFALLLRPQIAQNLDGKQLARARAALEDAMGLVPDGEVMLGLVDQPSDNPEFDQIDYKYEDEASASQVIQVACFFLDRYPVTNRQYQAFVVGGGYEQISLWDEEIWPAVLDFVDKTGLPGPRFWKNGTYPANLANHPVVGVSWYEANAFARWMGKRLPTEAEWVKAGSWPVTLSSNARVQRRYPWGDTMDRSRANLWGCGHDGTTPVDQFPEGVSVGGVYDLIGNVWEWTRGTFNAGVPPHEGQVLDVPMKSIRGGAFDTYLDNQASCQFQSGEVPMARKRNIGFRCCVGACDLVPRQRGTQPQAEPEPQEASVEEVQV